MKHFLSFSLEKYSLNPVKLKSNHTLKFQNRQNYESDKSDQNLLKWPKFCPTTLITKRFGGKCFGEKTSAKKLSVKTLNISVKYFGQIFHSKKWFFLMKTKRDWVNLAYKISTRKGKATDWISKSSKKTLKQVNIRYSTYKLQGIMKDNVNQFKDNSELFIVSSACLSVTYRHQDQQRDFLTVAPSLAHLWFQPLWTPW